MMIKQGFISPDSINPVTEYFSIGRLAASAGPGMVWKIYDATRTSDKKVRCLRLACSVALLSSFSCLSSLYLTQKIIVLYRIGLIM